jgi:Tetracyclin repressor-like, C-terminal domain
VTASGLVAAYSSGSVPGSTPWEGRMVKLLSSERFGLSRPRLDQVAAALAASLASRPVLCDLLSAQAAVLERNVSPKVAAEYKQAAIANVTALSRLVLGCVAELGERDAGRFAAAAVMVAGAVWTHAQPSAALLAAYQADPALAVLRVEFTATVREVLEVLISGLLARRSRPAPPRPAP